ncbi:MAG: hypothetical protein REI95_13890, partial [Oxalicibacterium faecigallinarum]|uniref:hypothetical protein n=1 Tax=Oxalicibacterium faecigallinarum TaxID=573741 RepID=UPI0028094265
RYKLHDGMNGTVLFMNKRADHARICHEITSVKNSAGITYEWMTVCHPTIMGFCIFEQTKLLNLFPVANKHNESWFRE